MRKIKLFLEFVASDFVKASKFIPQKTIEQLAKMFEQSPEYILEFEAYLEMVIENGGDNGPEDPFWSKNFNSETETDRALAEYKFHLEGNYPSYRESEM